MKRPPRSIARACRLEGEAARLQARAALRRAETLHAIARIRMEVARTDPQRGPALRAEAILSEREAVLHETSARVLEAEARRADSQAQAEESIQLRKAAERRARSPRRS